MDRAKKILVGAIIIVSVIVFSSIFLFNKWTKETPTTTTTMPTTTTIAPTTTTISTAYENPRLIETIDRDIEIVSENPDLIFEDWSGFEDLIYEAMMGTFISIKRAEEKFSPWYSDGHYLIDHPTIERIEKGIVSLHPESTTKPHYLGQNITLGDGGYILVATLANLAEHFEPCGNRSDNIFKVKIKDLVSKSEEIIYEEVIRSDQGWQTRYLNISDYKNKKISFVLESHAGGTELWCGEYGFVDEFYIARLK